MGCGKSKPAAAPTPVQNLSEFEGTLVKEPVEPVIEKKEPVVEELKAPPQDTEATETAEALKPAPELTAAAEDTEAQEAGLPTKDQEASKEQHLTPPKVGDEHGQAAIGDAPTEALASGELAPTVESVEPVGDVTEAPACNDLDPIVESVGAVTDAPASGEIAPALESVAASVAAIEASAAKAASKEENLEDELQLKGVITDDAEILKVDEEPPAPSEAITTGKSWFLCCSAQPAKYCADA